MAEIYKFNEQPRTINNGGYLKGQWIVWLNLGVTPNVSSIVKSEEDNWMFQAHTERLALKDNSLSAFMEVVDPKHLAMATTEDIEAILKYFNAIDDIESWRDLRRTQIQGYDCSDNVNRFYLDETPMWLDKATRVGLVNSLTIERDAGIETSELWVGLKMIEIKVVTALQLLATLELYAKACYSVTAGHIAKVETFQSIEELRDFDIAADYPYIPHFTVE